MNSPSRTLVHHYLASRLRIDPTSIHDARSLDELGVDPLDLVLIVLRLEDANRDAGELPLDPLDDVTTVGDLVTVVDRWLRYETAPCSVESARLSSRCTGHDTADHGQGKGG